MAGEFIRYANQGATRNLPLSPRLTNALSYLPGLGVTAEVFSGGQPAKGSGGKRVGSIRHDHGEAADVRFFKDGRQLDWSRPEDIPLFQAIVAQGRENGITGFGAGPGYMSQGTMHVGFGAPSVWGAGGKSANAPEWLRTAYYGAKAPEQPVRMADTGAAMSDATSFIPNERIPSSTERTQAAGAAPMAARYGSLGGLGGAPAEPEQAGIRGFFKSNPGITDTLQAIGLSLMSSPGNAPLQNVGEYLPSIQRSRSAAEDRALEREQQRQQQLALGGALQIAGFSPEEAQAFAVSPTAASTAIAARETQEGRTETNRTKAYLREAFPQIADMVDAGLPVAEGFKMAADARANAGRVPDLEVFYDNETGREYKGYLDPATGQPVRVGGLKAAPQGDAGVTVLPDGTVQVGGQVGDRRILASQFGLDPNSPEGRAYILTGNLPSQDRGVTAADRVAIREADDIVVGGEATIGLLDRAAELSGTAYDGFLAGPRAAVMGNVFGDQGALDTREYDNIITEQALGQLKAIFGGAPTEGERAILLEIQGSSSQPQSVRESILKRAKAAVERRVNFNRDRATELRGGTYYDPRPAPNGAQPAGPVTAGPSAETVTDPVTAGVPATRSQEVFEFQEAERRSYESAKRNIEIDPSRRDDIIRQMRDAGFKTDGL